MPNLNFDREITALLVIDPYNDFISEGGKIWDRIKTVAEANNCIPNMLQILNAARQTKLRVFYAMHHRCRVGDYETWQYIAPIQKAAWSRRSFEYGTWGGKSAPNSLRCRARLWLKNIGVPAGLPTQTSTSCSKGMASKS